MAEEFFSSDNTILDLLRRHGSLTVTELVDMLQVTATAVRQRLSRLTFQGYVERKEKKQDRGRPTHAYALTSAGRRKAGENFADLATALWEEIRSISDRNVRDQLIDGIAKRLAKQYANRIQGETPQDKMNAIAALFGERQIPMEVKRSQFPELTVLACPYPDLANQDDAICVMEQRLLSHLVGEPLTLAECTFHGGTCCRFGAANQTVEVPKQDELSKTPVDPVGVS